MSERAAKLPGLGIGRRRVVHSAASSLVRQRPLFPDRDLPLLIEPAVSGVVLQEWLADHRGDVETALGKHGGILFRGFGLSGAGDLEGVVAAACGESLEYKERSSPRTAVSGNIYTSTDYPPEYPIFLHNENSYQQSWPLKIFFLCDLEAATGGETPIADCRRILARIPPRIRDRFAARRWMVQRNYGEGFGLSWDTVFSSDDPETVERYCRENGIEAEWVGEGRLRTRSVRSSVSRHPRTAAATWFNHATFFHVTTLEPAVRDVLLAEFSEDELPTNTYYGDGSPIDPEDLAALRSIYRDETVVFPWRQGDLLLLDNMLTAHGRAPFTGERRILVGMGEAVRRQDVEEVRSFS